MKKIDDVQQIFIDKLSTVTSESQQELLSLLQTTDLKGYIETLREDIVYMSKTADTFKDKDAKGYIKQKSVDYEAILKKQLCELEKIEQTKNILMSILADMTNSTVRLTMEIMLPAVTEVAKSS